MNNQDRAEKHFSVIDVKTQVMENEAKEAEEIRKWLADAGVLFVNLMASPGAGKTTTLVRTIEMLRDRYRIGVIEADASGDVDAQTIAGTGVRVLQVHTGGSCHMDAAMTRRALEALGTEDLDIIFLENIGNLVCPAEFDTGAAVRAVMPSTPEGHDKPLKYPLMFTVADIILMNKMDVADVFDFDPEEFKRNVRIRNTDAPVIPVSARTGAGFGEWISFLEEAAAAIKTSPAAEVKR